MALGRARHRSGGGAAWLGMLLLAAGVVGCSGPIEAYRSVSGMNKNDPDPATAPYTANLDKAETGAYPNLASVPEPPIIATTVAERQTLTTSLTGERSATQANGGTPAPGPVPPPPAIPPGLQAPELAALPQPVPPPQTPLPPLRGLEEPAPPQPPTSPVRSPSIANPPLIEASRPAPARGQPSAMPKPGTSELAPAAIASANPQPSPPPAALPPPQVPPEVAARPAPRLPPALITVASVEVPPGSMALAADMKPHLADIVTQYKQRPRTVRVVSYAAAATGGAEQLNAFRSALDRAQIVASALAGEGIPAKQIQTEASPSTAAAPVGRIEVQLMP